MLKIIADDKIPFLKGILEPFAEVVYLPGGKITRADLMDADALLTRTRTLCNAGLLDGTKVRFIASATIGYDHIDTRYCEEHGIFWTNAPGCNSESVAQYITSLLLTDARRTGRKLKGMTIGVVGVGNVGSKVARNARALGMKVLLNDPPRARKEGPEAFTDIETVRRDADYITFHVPLIRDGADATWHYADAEFLRGMKKNAFLINSSRGEVCDNSALKEALRKKQIRGAALDVWENEPGIDLELLGLLDFATPHIAGYSADGKSNGTAMSVRALIRFFGLEKQFDPGTLQTPPEPAHPQISLPEGAETEELLYQAVAASYDIVSDDERLRAAPGDFEKQRGAYPLRREFDSFTVTAPPGPAEILRRLRFRIRAGEQGKNI